MKDSAIVLKWRIKWFCQQHLPEYQHRWTHHCLPLLTWSIPTSGTGNTKFSSEKLCRSSSFEHIIFILFCFKLGLFTTHSPPAAFSLVFFILFGSLCFLFHFIPFLALTFHFFHTHLKPSSKALSHFLPSLACQSQSPHSKPSSCASPQPCFI